MNYNFIRILCAAILFLTSAIYSQKIDNKIISLWKFNKSNIVDKEIKDKTGKNYGRINGKIIYDEAAGLQSLKFDGVENSVLITDDISKAVLPEKDFSIACWVRYTSAIEFGGFLSVFQDNGGYEKGWMFGFTGKQFAFALSTIDSDDGDGVMTYLNSRYENELGKWYHVTGVYNGEEMQIYVNGELRNSTYAQSGNILYPENAEFIIGSYKDKNENFPIKGNIAELALYNTALTGEEIKRLFNEHKYLSELKYEESSNTNFLTSPYLQFATKNSIRVLWETKNDAASAVEYGSSYPPSELIKFNELRTFHEFELNELTPETNYFYRIYSKTEDGNEEVSDIYTFQTAVNDETAYTFCIIGDTQTNPDVWGNISTRIYAERPNFVLHAGDIVGTGGDKSQWLDHFLGPAKELMRRIPVYTVLGNHEDDDGNYYKYMSNPEPEWYYSFAYGNAEYFMIDSNHPINEGSEQYNWLADALKKSIAKWKFAVFHHPPYSSDENDYGDTYRGTSTKGDREMQPIVKLFEKYGVDIVFNGHIHVYERTWQIKDDKAVEKNGVVYVVTGGAGGGLENFAPTNSGFTVKIKRDHHYCKISINGNKLIFNAIDQNGALFDYFEMTK